ncbi:NmrA family transcriptional regulator [Pseudomonas sp. Leaf15]|uniref:NmrA family NAD(P)-binding protein n=1 Tax=unclassified Pseudomonas TaxID=196821 RepID=UPI0007027333|nr:MULTISPECIES: NmrA family NAD(P)-binding protein [unclassified Pseudomonas]KQM50649.1 NmrA family transcriptional regulator [Pseudomonas sp. Leaf15]RAH04587.1 NmrA family transcriptional regulator [Pseudomonas sp. Leaf98]
MYVITGITGKVGGALARNLIKAGQPVRAVMRDAGKAAYWADQGCDVVFAQMDDAQALAEAFKGATGVFILPPPGFDPQPGFPEARAVIAAVSQALQAATPKKVLCLSTIGAQATEVNLLTQRTLMEQALSALDIPVTFLRPAWFMENALYDLIAARETGVIHSFLQPLDKAVPMIATADIGTLAAQLLQQEWAGHRVVELEGQWVSPNDIAQGLSQVLDRDVRAEAVARETWEALLRAQGAQNPLPRMRMVDGFNEGWICFEQEQVLKGQTSLLTVLRELADNTR